MRTLGRILIILAVFAFIMGITYTIVNVVSSSIGIPAFERGGEGFPQQEGVRPPFSNDERPEFPGGEERELRGGGSALRGILGAVKNTVIIAIVVALVVWLKDFMQNRKRNAEQASE